MKSRLLTGLAFIAALSAPPISAETVVYQNDFTQQAQFNDMTIVNADNSTNASNGLWRNYVYSSYSRAYIYVIYDFDTETATPCDDYLVTPELALKSGHLYRLSYNAQGGDYTKRLDYKVKTLLSPADAAEPATGDDFTGYTLIADHPDLIYVSGYNWTDPGTIFSEEIVPTADGNYRIAFHAYAGGIVLSNIKLVDMGSDATPGAVTDFAVTPGENATTTATLTCTLPGTAATGADLTGTVLSVKITRTIGEETKEYTVENLTPGAPFSWQDTDNPAGNVTYTLQVVNGTEVNAPVSATVYVGPDTPKAVTALTLNRADGINTISWTAPTAGVNGSTELALTYEVARVVNGEATVLVSDLAETTYADEFSSTELATVTYTVTPINYGSVRGTASKTTAIQLGSKSLPFEDSFANKTLDADIWSQETNTAGSSYKWTATTSNRVAKSPYDEDGGFLGYNSYSSSRDNWCRLITPPRNLAAVGNPIISFAFFNTTSSSSNDRIVIEVSKDNADWTEVEGSEIKRYSSTASNDWTVYEFSLAPYKDCESARVAIKAISGYGTDMALDAVRIYAGIENDLAVQTFDGPAAITAGKEGSFTATVTNLGGNTLDGSEYTVEFSVNGSVFATLPGSAIAPKETADFTAPLALTAAHIGEEFEIAANVVFEADEVADNNASATIATTAKAYSGPGITGLNGALTKDGLILTWEAPVNEVFDNTEFTVNAEGLEITEEAYEADQSLSFPADMNGWANLDIDGLENLVSYYPMQNPNKNARAFQYISTVFMTNNSFADGFGDGYIMVFPCNKDLTTATNDWLISPTIPGAGVHTLSLKAKPEGNSYGRMGMKFDVLYTTSETYSAENPAESFTLLETVDIKGGNDLEAVWESFSFEIPADAKHVAINFNTPRTSYSRDTGYSWIKFDDITLTCESLGNPQFNVYTAAPAEEAPATFAMQPAANGLTLLNEAPLTESEFTVADFAEKQQFNVSAVYNGGESALSETYLAPKPDSGIADITAGEIRVTVAGRTISAAAAGESIDVTVHAANGTLIGSSKTVTVAAPGVYIVNAAGSTTRVAVR